MRSLLLNHIQNAKQSIKSSRLRSFLTTLGITIGVASITTILSLSAGATSIISQQIDDLGGNIAVIRPGAPSDNLDGHITNLNTSQFTSSPLTDTDVTIVKDIPNVTSVAPIMVLHGAVDGAAKGPANTAIVATTPELEKVSDLAVRDGQFIDNDLNPNTAVIGPQLSIALYGTEQSIGKTMRIKGQTFTIVGVLKRTNTPVNYNQVDFDNSVVIRIDAGRSLNQGAVQLQQINVQTDSVVNLQNVVTETNKALLISHLGQVDFSVLTGAEISQPTSKIFSAIAGVSVVIAAISLLVGGVGVMNIMLVNVAERTREIGIRKALGATNTDIVLQFLIESLALSVSGGVIGYIIGYIVAFGISTFLTFAPLFTWEIAAVAFGASLITGTLFGLYPALRAAKKDPISALRQYD